MSAGTFGVLHVCQPTEAGVAEVVVQLVRDQVGRGWDVHVACPDAHGLHARLSALGAQPLDWQASRAPGPRTVGEVVRLRRLVRRVRPDVVCLHSSKAGLAGRLAIRGEVPTVFQPHMWSFQAGGQGLRAASRLWERTAARWTSAVVCVSRDEYALGRAAGVLSDADLVTVIPNGVDVEHFVPRDRRASRSSLGVRDRPTVVCVGRVAEQKGQDILLGAWPRVVSAVPDAQLVVVGDGPRADAWRTEYRVADDPSIVWLGALDDPSAAYATGDVVVLPSRSEAMALVVLEAMSCARAVVAFDVGGVDECVADCGAVVPPRDVDALIRAVVHRLQDPDVARREGDAARRRVVEHFSCHRSSSDLSSFLRRVAVDGAGDRCPHGDGTSPRPTVRCSPRCAVAE